MKHLATFIKSFTYTTILLLPLVLLAKMDSIQQDPAKTNDRMEQVSSHLGYVEDRLNNPEIVYQVDSAGAAWHGKVTAKEIKNDRYGVEIGSYGWFLVTKEQYDSIMIGDDMPEYLRGR